MNILLPFLSRRLCCRFLFLCGLIAASHAAPAADDAHATSALVIAQGTIVGASTNSQPTRATLRNLADELMRRYRSTTINITGVDDVVIDNVTIRWPTVENSDQVPDAVNAILSTLAEAAEHRTFSVSRPGWNTFLLSRPRGPARTERNIEVFNLRHYLKGGGNQAALETALRESELRLSALMEELRRVAREVSGGLVSSRVQEEAKHRVELEENRHQLLKQQLQRMTPTKEQTSKRIDQLSAAVKSTLAKLDPREKAPEFEYHDGTHLLIVIGSETALDVARKVVTALEKSSD